MKRREFNLLNKRMFGIVIVECDLSNPNGNPDEDNTPRLLLDDHGMISPVCMKHRIRELLEDHDSITWKYLQNKLDLNEEEFFIWESALKGYDVDGPVEAKKEWDKLVKKNGPEALLKRFWDMRVFGTTALEKGEKGKNALNFKRTGVATVTALTSILPLEIISQTITKGNPLRPKLMEKGQGDIAPFGFKIVRHGLYVGQYVINPFRAHHTNTSEKDIEVFKTLLPYAFSNSTSASRAGVRVVQAIHATHSNPLCSFNEGDLFNYCVPQTELEGPSTSLDDYSFRSINDIQSAFPDIDVEMMVDLSDSSKAVAV